MYHPVHLLLPPALYAVPGIELNVYFDNIVSVSDAGDFYFDVECPYGRQDKERWRFIPEERDVGIFSLKINVYDNSFNWIAEAATEVFVSPEFSGTRKEVSVMLVGDSLTNAAVYPKELYNRLNRNPHRNVRFVGGNWKAGENAVRHEGRPGWKDYCEMYEDAGGRRDDLKTSPFL